MPPLPVPEILALAMRRHQAGQLAEAEGLYRQILAAEPNHPDALHLMGVLAHQAGRQDMAARCIGRALELNPNNPLACFNLAKVHRARREYEPALQACRRALELQPDFCAARRELGLVLLACGRTEEALAAFREVIRLRPNETESYNDLGNALVESRRYEEAIEAYRAALERQQDSLEAWHNLGGTLAAQGRHEEAGAAFRREIELQPHSAQAHHNLGLALYALGCFPEAVAAYRRALELDPGYVRAGNNLGLALVELGRMEEAAEAYRRALAVRPEYALAWSNLGNVWRKMGRLGEAIEACREAIRHDESSGEAWNFLGLALAARGQRDEAMAAYREALQRKPGSVMAHNNLGSALKNGGRFDEAIAEFREALRLAPGKAWIHSNLIGALYVHPGQDYGAIAGEHRKWDRQFGGHSRRGAGGYENDRDPERRLRVGYVSADFCAHVVGRNIAPLLEQHDRERFEIYCYSAVVKPDHFTEKMRGWAAQWREIPYVKDELLADWIRRDGIDLLVDLAQHSTGNRLPLFARRPAPVQVSSAGYPDTAGLEAIGYRISDRYLEGGMGNEHPTSGSARHGVAEGEAGPTSMLRPDKPNIQHSTSNRPDERVFLLDSFWCYDPAGLEVPVNALPARTHGWLTFGSLNHPGKINESVLELWGRILHAVPDSRLLLLSPLGSYRKWVLEVVGRCGVEASRVEFVERMERRSYLELHRRIDIILDPFPYNGHTTSLDALSMGVPVVTLAGEHAVSRAGLSQLGNLGLEELVAFSEPEYVAIATRLARDLARLEELRSSLRARMLASVLMDSKRFARGIEAAYRAMWRNWCSAPD